MTEVQLMNIIMIRKYLIYNRFGSRLHRTSDVFGTDTVGIKTNLPNPDL